MATNAIAGYKGFVYTAPVSSTLQRIAELREYTISMEMDEIDVTSHDSSGIKEHLPGVKTWSASVSYLYAQDSTSQKQLFNALINETTMSLEFYPAGTSSQFPIFTGNAYVSSWELSGPNEEAHAQNVEFIGTATLTMTTSS